MNKLKIIILGANSHIAKGFIYNFFKHGNISLYLYTRSVEKTKKFIDSLDKNKSTEIIIKEGYAEDIVYGCDLLINCIGVGTPKNLKRDYSPWFSTLEKFDNLCLNYLQKNTEALYISLSSGSVYGKDFPSPVIKDSTNSIKVNNINIDNFYSIAKIYSEAKHRSYSNLNIVDLRIFSYFSRFMDLEEGYFLGDIINSVLNKQTLLVGENNIIRDYIHPEDLSNIVLKCLKIHKLNTAFDLISKAPTNKNEILNYFSTEYGLKYEIKNNLKFLNSSGIKDTYCSNYNNVADILNYSPKYTSLETIALETKNIIRQFKIKK